MKKIIKNFIVAALAAMTLASCQKTAPIEALALADGESTQIDVPALGMTKTIKFLGSRDITATFLKEMSWASANVVGHTVVLTVKTTTAQSARKVDLQVSDGVDVIILNVNQAAGTFDFEPEESYELDFEEGGSIDIPCVTAFGMELTSSATWLKAEYLEAQNIVRLSAGPATESREATVSYVSGNYNGEIVVSQNEKVQAELTVFLSDEKASAGYTKENSVWFTLKGKKIASGAVVLAPTSAFESYGDEYFEDLLLTDEDFAFDADDIKKINSDQGYTGGFINLVPGTDYTVLALASNGKVNGFFKGSVTTEGEVPDAINLTYGIDDIETKTPYADYLGNYAYTADLHWYSSKQSAYVHTGAGYNFGSIDVESRPDVTAEFTTGTETFKAVAFEGLFKNPIDMLYYLEFAEGSTDMKFAYDEKLGILYTYGFDEGESTIVSNNGDTSSYGANAFVVEDPESGNGYFANFQLIAGFTSDGALTVVNIDSEYQELQLWASDSEGYMGLFGLSDIILTKGSPVGKTVKAPASKTSFEKFLSMKKNMPKTYMESNKAYYERVCKALHAEKAKAAAVAARAF